MKFINEGPIPDYLKAVIAEFSQAIERGWPSAQISKAFVHVGQDDQNRDVIYFDIADAMGLETTLECAPSESAQNIQLRARERFGEVAAQNPVTSGANIPHQGS